MFRKQATIQDIANALGITASTVSRALSGHPKIKQATKDVVLQKARELHYQPNSLAASLRKGKANTIGMIVPRINRHFFSNVINGVESVLNPAGYNLIICQSDETLVKEKQNIKTLMASRVDGILISTSIETVGSEHLKKVLSMHIPLVMFDRVSSDLEVSKVVNDDEIGSYDLTQHLIGQGFKSFMWVGGPRTSSIYLNRYNGFKRALIENGFDISAITIFEGKNDLPAAKDFIVDFINKKNKLPEVIFAVSDLMALGVYHALESKGIAVPDQVALAGYSNEPFSAYISPKLTSVEQFSEEMGRSAAKLLLEDISNKTETFVPRTISIRPKLIVRESSLKH